MNVSNASMAATTSGENAATVSKPSVDASRRIAADSPPVPKAVVVPVAASVENPRSSNVAVPAGADGAPFSGTFTGGGHTLTVALSGTDPYVAPFAAISGATISNLVVAGTVSGGMHCSGLVGLGAGGTNTIENCRIDAAVSTSKSHFGGVVGHGYVADTTLRGCVFSGSLSGGTYVATFNGWSDGGAATTLIDCLDKSTSTHPIGRGHDAACVSNTYYFATKNFNNGERLWSEGKRGKRAYAVTSGEGVTINFGAPAATTGRPASPPTAPAWPTAARSTPARATWCR